MPKNAPRQTNIVMPFSCAMAKDGSNAGLAHFFSVLPVVASGLGKV